MKTEKQRTRVFSTHKEAWSWKAVLQSRWGEGRCRGQDLKLHKIEYNFLVEKVIKHRNTFMK